MNDRDAPTPWYVLGCWRRCCTERATASSLPQVGFERKDGNGWDYFAEEDLRAKSGIAERIARAYGRRRVILFDGDATRERLLATLGELGIPFKKEDEFRGFPPFASGEVTTEVQARFDNYLARAVCKIAFNYLAKTQARLVTWPTSVSPSKRPRDDWGAGARAATTARDTVTVDNPSKIEARMSRS